MVDYVMRVRADCRRRTTNSAVTVTVAQYVEPPYAWCCVITHDCVQLLHRVNSDGFVTARIYTVF